METKNLDIYGSGPIPWTRVREALAGESRPRCRVLLLICPELVTSRTAHKYTQAERPHFGIL